MLLIYWSRRKELWGLSSTNNLSLLASTLQNIECSFTIMPRSYSNNLRRRVITHYDCTQSSFRFQLFTFEIAVISFYAVHLKWLFHLAFLIHLVSFSLIYLLPKFVFITTGQNVISSSWLSAVFRQYPLNVTTC